MLRRLGKNYRVKLTKIFFFRCFLKNTDLGAKAGAITENKQAEVECETRLLNIATKHKHALKNEMEKFFLTLFIARGMVFHNCEQST